MGTTSSTTPIRSPISILCLMNIFDFFKSCLNKVGAQVNQIWTRARALVPVFSVYLACKEELNLVLVKDSVN